MLESFYQFSYISNIVSYDNLLPALASLSVILLLLHKLFFKVRTKFSITVNCWFCSSNASVPYNSSNSWYCPKCDQYNGFTADGSYNRLLTEQFNARMNCDSWTVKTRRKQAATNGLCRFCNINLELKIQQLAQFVPLNKTNYDEEVQQYSDQLERVYKLCSKCQNVLDKTLHEKQETYILKQQQSFKPTSIQVSQKPSMVQSVCLHVTRLLSVGLLLSAVPPGWITYLVRSASLPGYINDVLLVAQSHAPQPDQLLVFLSSVGVIIQLCDLYLKRNISSGSKLLVWVVLPSLTHVPAHFDGLVSNVKVLVGAVLLMASLTERRLGKCDIRPKNNPLQFQKLDRIPEVTPQRKRVSTTEEQLNNSTLSPKSTVSDSSPNLVHEQIPEDIDFGKLNVSSRRVTRSQVKPFQPKQYVSTSQVQNNLFKPKPVNLSPPKLQFDDYQIPLTRSSSQSSGFVSLSHQKYFDESRPPSLTADDIDSVSQCAGGIVPRYQQNSISPMSYSPQYGMPFSHFQPYAIVHYSHSNYNKMFPYHDFPSIEPHSLSTFTKEVGWMHRLKNGLYSSFIFILVLTNLAVLWKEFGQNYFKLTN